MIHIVNPNDWESITANVADAVNNGGSCTVSSPTVIVLASSFVDVTYTCTYGSAPSPSNGTNTATVTWNGAAASTPSSSATGTASFDFGSVSPTLIDTCVAVSDTLGGSLGTVCVGGSNPTTFNYSKTFTDPVGVCTSHTNTATFTTNDTGATGSASQTVTDCQTGGFVSDTGFCSVPLTNTRLVFTQDSSTTYNLQASNPGQYYYNFFFVGSAASATTFTATIPFPFVTQGAVPIQVFNASLFPSCGGTVPSSNFNSLFSISPTSITLSSYSPQNMGSTVTVTFTVGSGGLPSGSYWFAIHLNYGLKGFDYTKSGSNAIAATGPSVTILNGQTYTFSNSVSASSTISSSNVFYKDPGFIGVITNSAGTPISGVSVKISIGGSMKVVVYTDQNGVYQYQYTYSGPKTTYTITATYGTATKTVTGSLTTKSLITADFTF
jgi:hypothetical protein